MVSSLCANEVYQSRHEARAGLDLTHFDVFIGLVRLGDRAGAAEHGRESRCLKLAGFGAVGDRRARIFQALQLRAQLFCGAVRFVTQARHVGQ